MNIQDLSQYTNVRDFAMDLINELSVTHMQHDTPPNMPDIRGLTLTLDTLIELEHEAAFVDDPDTPRVKQRCEDLESAVRRDAHFSQLLKDQPHFNIYTHRPTIDQNDTIVYLDTRFDISIGEFKASIPGRIFNTASVKTLMDWLHIQYQNEALQPAWQTIYSIDPRQLNPRVIGNIETYLRHSERHDR